MIKKLSCVSHGSLKRFPHTFTTCRIMFGKQLLVLNQLSKFNSTTRYVRAKGESEMEANM